MTRGPKRSLDGSVTLGTFLKTYDLEPLFKNRVDGCVMLTFPVDVPTSPRGAQPVVVETAVPAPQGGTSAVNTVWPTFGLPVGYTPQNQVEVQQSPQNTRTRVPLVQQGFVSQQENLDDPRNAYQSPGLFDDVPKVNSNVPQLEEARQKFKAIEDRLSMMEGADPLDLANMCLVPDLVLPPKFKVPDFEKYKGLSCPKNHLIMYSRKMASFAKDDKLMMHCFQDSLTGASLNWYVQLEGSRIQSWSDLANAFIKQYQYNIDMAPDRTQLQNMSQEEGESFRVYAQRWRELAAQVHPPLLEAELVDIFTNTLQGAYFEKMVGSVSSGFSDMVKIGERIEMGIKSEEHHLISKDQPSAKVAEQDYLIPGGISRSPYLQSSRSGVSSISKLSKQSGEQVLSFGTYKVKWRTNSKMDRPSVWAAG
ncbi:unnamed protein product [Trifolium pratense]|uniref:Uncharacterized protein n=1 Tax=Trifolium pratense TaxID=57577 RepID=A0ACB0JE05_TRIPR|nr:unnamed protein product [Trifolium pratense]